MRLLTLVASITIWIFAGTGKKLSRILNVLENEASRKVFTLIEGERVGTPNIVRSSGKPANTMHSLMLILLLTSSVALSRAQIENNMKSLQNMALPTLIPLPSLSSLSKNLQAFSGFLPNQPSTAFQQQDSARKEKIPCTCGVFLSGQFKKGSQQPPNGNAVLLQELTDPLVCGPIGEKQCVNKCLESMVRHLPNSGPMICGSIDRDCFKERAYLFIKNCNDAWVNSNLSAGREYCCKDGLQYKCPNGLTTLTQTT